MNTAPAPVQLNPLRVQETADVTVLPRGWRRRSAST